MFVLSTKCTRTWKDGAGEQDLFCREPLWFTGSGTQQCVKGDNYLKALFRFLPTTIDCSVLVALNAERFIIFALKSTGMYRWKSCCAGKSHAASSLGINTLLISHSAQLSLSFFSLAHDEELADSNHSRTCRQEHQPLEMGQYGSR